MIQLTDNQWQAIKNVLENEEERELIHEITQYNLPGQNTAINLLNELEHAYSGHFIWHGTHVK